MNGYHAQSNEGIYGLQYKLSLKAIWKSYIHVHHQVSYMEFHNKSTSLYVECRTEFFDNPSLDFDCVFNCMTHSVLDDDEDLLNIDQIG